MGSGIAVARDKDLEIALGDLHRGAEVMRYEFTALDPAAHRALRHADELRHLCDREEFDFVVVMTATTDYPRAF